MADKSLHRKLNIEQQEPHYKPRGNSDNPKGQAVLTPHELSQNNTGFK